MPRLRRSRAVQVTAALAAEAKDIVVRPHFRRAIAAALLFVGASVVSVSLGGIHARHLVDGRSEPWLSHRVGSWAAAGVAVVTGVLCIRLIANELSRVLRQRGNPAAAGSLHLLIQIVGYLAVLLVIAGLLAVRVESLLLSGAIGSVVIGLAAQQALGNAIAGIVLLFARPFVVGDYITLRAGALGGQYDGEVVSITLMFTILQTAEGPISLPNSAVLAAATGRRQPPSALPPG
jgi:small-conductance mechanosensitive channel